MTSSPSTQALPNYLKKYITEQNYDSYTTRDHAAWRFIMRQHRAFFSRHAVPYYQEGLKKTGIPISHIPRIREMDACLANFGWGAVAVRGFIPPAAFLDFQSRAVLPVACDMRSVDHLAYTSAPDIVHEAAGHGPILADPAYARYLHRYAQMARKAIFSIDDIRMYEAIRFLSDIKENPDSRPDTILLAEQKVREATAALTYVSENTKVTRMNWWTVEYGLCGDVKNPLIYGAGLLSSIGESQTCLSPKIKKLPLTLDCIHTSYDITERQPQLFVTPNMDHLLVVLEQLEQTLSFVKGGISGLEIAQKAETVCTVKLDNGLEMSGILTEFLVHEKQPCFVKFAGPVQISHEEIQIENQGPSRHPHGFSGPLGPWTDCSEPHHLQASDLKTHRLIVGQRARIETTAGFIVEGKLKSTTFKNKNLLLLTWTDVTVTRQGEIFFDRSWGDFDMPIGTRVISVYGGPAQKETFGDFDVGTATSSPVRTTPFTKEEKRSFEIYGQIRQWRSGNIPPADQRLGILETVESNPQEWLLQLETVELAETLQKTLTPQESAVIAQIKKSLTKNNSDLIGKGLAIANRPD